MIQLSAESKRLVSAFLAFRNDIDIYTEDDEKDKEFYKALLRRLVPPAIKINDVTPLGSRKNVLTRCATEPNNGRRKIFIIDGDIGVIHGVGIPSMKGLFVLDSYCIENFLLDRGSATEFVYFESGVKDKDSIERELDFETMIVNRLGMFRELFLCFAIANLAGLPFTINCYHRFWDEKNKRIAGGSLDQEINQVKTAILAVMTQEDLDVKLELLSKQWDLNCDTLLRIISGKDYILPMFQGRSTDFKDSKIRASIQQIKLRLAVTCDLSRLAGLKAAIEAA